MLSLLLELDELNESFDTQPVPVTLTNISQEEFKGEFEIGDLSFMVDVTGDIDRDRYEVAFSLHEKEKYNFELTNTGHQFKVFATVINFVLTFVNAFDFPEGTQIEFSADKDERSRAPVYERLLKKNIQRLPGNWSYRIKDDSTDVHFILEKVSD